MNGKGRSYTSFLGREQHLGRADRRYCRLSEKTFAACCGYRTASTIASMTAFNESGSWGQASMNVAVIAR